MTMRRVQKKLGLLVLAGCAVAATAACTTTETAPISAPSGPSAPSGTSAPSAPSATASHATDPAPSPTTSSAAPAKNPGQGGQGGGVDWKRAAFAALGCKRQPGLPARAEVQHVDHADLTGDGQRDTIVAASCPTTTSTNAVHVFVFEGDSSTKPLLTVGKDAYLRTAGITTHGRTLGIDSEALSKQASLCCPDLRIKQSWTWTGTAFEQTGLRKEKIG
jgi:hypothetical protein